MLQKKEIRVTHAGTNDLVGRQGHYISTFDDQKILLQHLSEFCKRNPQEEWDVEDYSGYIGRVRSRSYATYGLEFSPPTLNLESEWGKGGESFNLFETYAVQELIRYIKAFDGSSPSEENQKRFHECLRAQLNNKLPEIPEPDPVLDAEWDNVFLLVVEACHIVEKFNADSGLRTFVDGYAWQSRVAA